MAANGYRQLHTVDDVTTEQCTHNIGAETSPGLIHHARTPSFVLQDQAGRHCYVSVDEGHPTRNPDAPQHDTPLLSNPEISDSSASVETGDDEPGNGSQRPALDQSAEHTHPAWTDFYFRPLFLISLSVFLVLMIAALEVGHYISQHNQGLVTASEDMHYVWTYGPTLGNFQSTRLGSL